MPSSLTCLNVFIASPAGLDEERKAFREVIEAYNHSDAIPRSVYFRPLGWEETLGGVGRPQSIINEDVRVSDFFVLVLCDRWGSPPDPDFSPYTSGTEEEYQVARECHASDHFPMRQMVLFFKAVDLKQLADAGPLRIPAKARGESEGIRAGVPFQSAHGIRRRAGIGA